MHIKFMLCSCLFIYAVSASAKNIQSITIVNYSQNSFIISAVGGKPMKENICYSVLLKPSYRYVFKPSNQNDRCNKINYILTKNLSDEPEIPNPTIRVTSPCTISIRNTETPHCDFPY